MDFNENGNKHEIDNSKYLVGINFAGRYFRGFAIKMLQKSPKLPKNYITFQNNIFRELCQKPRKLKPIRYPFRGKFQSTGKYEVCLNLKFK